jgi:hypothetical protein
MIILSIIFDFGKISMFFGLRNFFQVETYLTVFHAPPYHSVPTEGIHTVYPSCG